MYDIWNQAILLRVMSSDRLGDAIQRSYSPAGGAGTWLPVGTYMERGEGNMVELEIA